MSQVPTLATGLPVTVPKGVPAWLIRLVALLVALAGPALDWIDPTGRLSTPGIQALIILVFLVVGFLIFTIHLFLAATHEYGWSTKAFGAVEAAEVTEAKQIWPQIRTEWQAAQPALEPLPGFAGVLKDVQASAAAVDQKIQEAVAAVPAPDVAAIAELVKAKLAADAAGITPAAAGQTS